MLIDLDDASATATKLSENQLLFRLGIVGRVASQLLFILVPFLLYKLFKVIHKDQALMMLILALVSVPLAIYNETYMLAALEHLSQPNQLMDSINAFSRASNLPNLFWGLWLIPLGTLVNKSDWFPKLIGYLLYIAAFGYISQTLLSLIAPDFTGLDVVLEILVFGELIFILWLLFKGINTKHENHT